MFAAMQKCTSQDKAKPEYHETTTDFNNLDIWYDKDKEMDVAVLCARIACMLVDMWGGVQPHARSLV
jgi:hypothetical protein